MRIDLRDGLKDELDTKVTLTLRWMFRIIFISLILGAVLFGWLTRKRINDTTAIENQIVNPRRQRYGLWNLLEILRRLVYRRSCP